MTDENAYLEIRERHHWQNLAAEPPLVCVCGKVGCEIAVLDGALTTIEKWITYWIKRYDKERNDKYTVQRHADEFWKRVFALEIERDKLHAIVGRAEAALGPVENGAPSVSRETLIKEHSAAQKILREIQL